MSAHSRLCLRKSSISQGFSRLKYLGKGCGGQQTKTRRFEFEFEFGQPCTGPMTHAAQAAPSTAASAEAARPTRGARRATNDVGVSGRHTGAPAPRAATTVARARDARVPALLVVCNLRVGTHCRENPAIPEEQTHLFLTLVSKPPRTGALVHRFAEQAVRKSRLVERNLALLVFFQRSSSSASGRGVCSETPNSDLWITSNVEVGVCEEE